MLELQGKIEIYDYKTPLGELELNDDGNAKLYIGNHCLKGKQVKLKKPFVMFDKDFRVQSVIRQKILFDSRPEHVSQFRIIKEA